MLSKLSVLKEYRLTHPIWSAVWGALIGTAILGTLAFRSSDIGHWCLLLWGSVLAVFTFLGSATVVANWLLTIWGIVTLLTVSLCGIAFRKTLDPRLHYTADKFCGLKWRWEYDDCGKPCNFHSYCPHCYFEITNHFGKHWSDRYNPLCRCPECRQKLQPLGDKHDVWAAIEHMIEKNIRTCDWAKARLASPQSAEAPEFDPRDAY